MQVARGVAQVMSDHWSARCSVHIWDRLGLSRRDMDTLRWLLSYVYAASSPPP